MAQVFFNSPPNWPLDDDFEPEPGWSPDPGWGPPPPGWQFWINEDGSPASLPIGFESVNPLWSATAQQQRAFGQQSADPALFQASLERGYWGRLLGCGIAGSVIGGILVGAAARDGSSFEAVLGSFALAAGSVLAIPGLIGWGIDASGVKHVIRRRP